MRAARAAVQVIYNSTSLLFVFGGVQVFKDKYLVRRGNCRIAAFFATLHLNELKL